MPWRTAGGVVNGTWAVFADELTVSLFAEAAPPEEALKEQAGQVAESWAGR